MIAHIFPLKTFSITKAVFYGSRFDVYNSQFQTKVALKITILVPIFSLELQRF